MAEDEQKIPSEQLFFAGRDYFASLLNDIGRARISIDMETYIFACDILGRAILMALAKAARRGVAVRVMVDGAGTPEWGNDLIEQLEAAGGETRVFNPFPWRLWQWSRSIITAPFLVKAIYLLLQINSRNHRKVCIIDKRIVYAGSFNISHNHIDRHRIKGWRDTAARLTDVNLQDLQLAFEAAWSHRAIPERIKQFFRYIATNPIIRLNNNRHRRRILYKKLLHQIRQCKRRIWITNAYFVPDNFLLRRLVDAASRGIDVRILLSARSDIAFMPWASQTFYARLLKSGIRIFEYLPAVLHAKTLILDDWMMIGSSNLNHRSLFHDLEVDINIRSAEAKDSLAKQFMIDSQNSREIFLVDLQKRNWLHRLIGNLILYLKYFI